MKSIIWKEFRENFHWAALMLVGMLVVMTAVLFEGFGWRLRDNIFIDAIFGTMLFGSCAAALALGFLQTVLEITRHDHW